MAMTKRTFFLVLFLTISTNGCSIYHVDSQDISSTFHPSKRSINEVEYLSEVERPHEIVGYVTVNTERSQKFDEIIERMKREAAILGGDAIINIRSDATGQWKRLPVQDVIGNAYIRANYSAAVIIFK